MTRRLGDRVAKFLASCPAALLVGLLVAAPLGCFEGAERDKPAPPGNLGGLCLAPDGHCTEGQCNQEKNYCYDAANPCEGFFCGGEHRGMCILDMQLQPTCACALGYNNATYELYCCPDQPLAEPDANCVQAMPSDSGNDSAASSSSSG